MISEQHRFHGYRSLGVVHRHGSTVRNQHMSLKFVRNQRRSTYRVAVIVSRKAHKSAVGRNRIRRRVYEVIRSQEGSITSPYDMVLSVFSGQVAEFPAAQVNRLVIDLLKQAHILGPATVGSFSQRGIVKTKEEKA